MDTRLQAVFVEKITEVAGDVEVDFTIDRYELWSVISTIFES